MGLRTPVPVVTVLAAVAILGTGCVAPLTAAVQYATQRGAQSVRIHRNGCLVARSGHDPYTETQRFAGWSMTKDVVSTVVGRAVNLGLLDVDDTVGAHLDGLRPEVGALTIQQFLTQTTGLRMAWANDLWAAGSTDSVADVLARPFQADPGSTFLYARTAVTVLVAVGACGTGLASSMPTTSRRDPGGARPTRATGSCGGPTTAPGTWTRDSRPTGARTDRCGPAFPATPSPTPGCSTRT